MGQASCPLWNNAPTSASATELMTLRKMFETTWTGPLRRGAGLESGWLLRKKNPPALDLALGSDM